MHGPSFHSCEVLETFPPLSLSSLHSSAPCCTRWSCTAASAAAGCRCAPSGSAANCDFAWGGGGCDLREGRSLSVFLL